MLLIILPIKINAVTIKEKDFYDSYNILLAPYDMLGHVTKSLC
jgi:hypothetical protein